MGGTFVGAFVIVSRTFVSFSLRDTGLPAGGFVRLLRLKPSEHP